MVKVYIVYRDKEFFTNNEYIFEFFSLFIIYEYFKIMYNKKFL